MRFLGRILAKIENLSNLLGSLALALMMLLGAFDVAGRYLLNNPIVGARELAAAYLMVAVVWLGLSRTQRLEEHIRLDIFFRNWPARRLERLDQAMSALAILPLAIIANRAWISMVDSLGQSTSGVMTIWPSASWAIVAVGATLLTLRLVLRALGVRDPSSTAEGIQNDA